MKQDKRSVVVIMGKSKYHEKCLMILENRNFKTLDHEKVRQLLRKVKVRLSQQKYLSFYPSGFCPGKYYRTATKYLKKVQLTNFQYSQLFQTLELLHTI